MRVPRSLSDWLLRIYAFCALGFLLAPVLLLVLFSFGRRPLAAFPFEGPTLHWYHEALDDPTTRDALFTSLKLALLSALIATVVAAAAAYGSARRGGKLASFFASSLGLPAVLPALVVGIALVTTFDAVGVQLGFFAALCGHVIVVLPFAFATAAARMANFDWSVEDAARDLGAGPVRTFTSVVLPAIRPALIGAMAIAMAFSLDEFVVTFFTVGTSTTLPIVIWTRLRTSLDPSVNALGTLILAGTSLLTVIAARVGSTRF
jgi:spermidine/putrescine transport system permease protein